MPLCAVWCAVRVALQQSGYQGQTKPTTPTVLNRFTWLRSFWNQRSRNPLNGSVSGGSRKFQMPSRERTSRDSHSWGYKISPVFVRDVVSMAINSIRPSALHPSSSHCWEAIVENCQQNTNSRSGPSVSVPQVLKCLVFVWFCLITSSYIFDITLPCTIK